MTQNEIIELAEAAGMTRDGDMWFTNGQSDMDVHIDQLEAFAKLIEDKTKRELREEIVYTWVPPHFVDLAVEEEREACAKVADEFKKQTLMEWPDKISDAIRARGNNA